jgi:hypothetical protein
MCKKIVTKKWGEALALMIHDLIEAGYEYQWKGEYNW